MRIISVVTLISPHGEYGGPVRVAVNQARQLSENGHDVRLLAGTSGFKVPPNELEGVPVTLFPAHRVLPGAGFAGLAAPALWRWLRQAVRDDDVVHIHAARDLVTLPAAAVARARGVRYVLQTHGMIDPSGHLLAKPLDALLTRPLLRDAHTVFHLTPVEREGLLAVGGPALNLVELPNGVPPAEPGTPTGTEVLYLARLAPRKRPVHFVKAAAELGREFPEATFRIVGPDEGEGAAVRTAIEDSGLGERIAWEGALPPDQTLERLRRASIYVLPAIAEPYPMSVLEAMSVGLPVVVTSSCGLSGMVAANGAGIVVDESLGALIDGIRALLAHPEAAADAGRRGRALVRTELAMPAIAERLVEVYSR